MTKVNLGKGLNALIPKDIDVSDKTRYVNIDIEKISANPNQPRKDFKVGSLKELADSIKQNGLLQPLVVRADNGSYRIVAGERRFRAAKMIGMERVPAIILENISSRDQLQLALIENLQREDLNVIELANGYSTLLEEYDLTQDELAKILSKDRSTITNTLRLLNLPSQVQMLIREGKVTAGHARAILALEDESKQIEAASRIVNDNLSVRTLETMVYGNKRRKRGRSLKLKKVAHEIVDAENRLKQHLATKVNIKRNLKRGRIEIEFYSDSDLTRLLDLIMSE
jgi:ParB family chromosome partitioning protein